MEQRFKNASDADKQHFKEASSASNTKKSTNTWVNVYKDWANIRAFDKNIYEYPPEELDAILQQFYMEVRKKDGSEYEPQCLNVMLTSIDRYLKLNGYTRSIVRDREFAASKVILEGVARDLRASGKGKAPNRTRSLTEEDEEALWANGEYGQHSPRALIQTLWWFISQHFGMRGRSEHHGILLEDFIIEKDSDREYICFREGLTKNHNGGLNFKPRKVKPKMYATGGERCPVAFFKLYQEKRPNKYRDSGPFYLGVIDNPKRSDVWYRESPMGVNTIDNLMKKMVERTPLADINRKYRNQSARKTSVRKMKKSGYVNDQIAHVTGHSDPKSLEAYDSGDEGEMAGLSSAIANSSEHPGIPVATTSQETLKAKSLERTFSFGVGKHFPSVKSQNVYIFNDCSDFTVNSAQLNKKKRRRVILSDSEDENDNQNM